MIADKYSQNILMSSGRFEREESYWMEKLAGDLMVAGFAPDYFYANLNSDQKGVEHFSLPGDVVLKFNSMSNRSKYGIYLLLLTGVAYLLHRYTGEEDITIGIPVFKQKIEPSDINFLLPLRLLIRSDVTFKDLLQAVNSTVKEADENRNIYYEKLIEIMNYNPSDNPVPFKTMVSLNDIQDENYFGDFGLPMLFSFALTEESIILKLKYNSSLYKNHTIQQLGNHLINFYLVITQDPMIRLQEVDILSPGERNRILDEFNDTKVEFSRQKTIQQLFEEQAQKTPNQIAIVFEDQQLTYRELNQEANGLAWLLKERGLKRADIVGIIINHSLEMVIGIIGILKAGGAYLPIDPTYPPNRILYMLEDSGASFLLTKTKAIRDFSFTVLQNFESNAITPITTGSRPQIKELDLLPIPDRTLIDYEKYCKYIGLTMVKNTITIQGSRGCPYNCAYCHKIWPKGHIIRSAENIFNEVMLYYNIGVRRFAFLDDIFNLDIKNSAHFFELVIEHHLKVELFFPNGMRGDILTEEYIDLMVKAGTTILGLSLETASPRLQKLIGKNLNLDKFRRNIQYIAEKHPQLILEINFMHGFPTETEAEAMLTLEFVKSIQWVHFPYFHILKIFPDTDMEQIALGQGVSKAAIDGSVTLAFHELPDTLPFDKNFTRKCQSELFKDYFLVKERLLKVLPYQMKVLTEDELVQKYNSYLPVEIKNFLDLLNFVGISPEELRPDFVQENDVMRDFRKKLQPFFPVKETAPNALRVLLLDLSQFFSCDNDQMLFDVVEPPLGLMYLLTYLNEKLGPQVLGKVAKSRIDFDSYPDLKAMIDEFKPDVIGVRTLTFYKDFFHKTVSLIRQWGVNVPVIAGGPHITSSYRTVLKDFNIDLAVLGEGEITLHEVIARMIENGGKMPSEEILKTIPGLAFVDHQTKTSAKQANRAVLFLDEKLPSGLPGQDPPNGNEPGDLAYVIYTSGSTGKPKGVMIEHKSLINLCEWHLQYYGVTGADRSTKYAGFGFDASVWETFPYLITGASLYIINEQMKLDLFRLNEYFETNQITISFLPTQFGEQFMKLDNKSLRKLLTGGDKLQQFIPRRYELINNYGPTENTVVATSYVMNKDCTNIPIGKPIFNTRVYIVDKNDNLQPVGLMGELCISGESLARGYLNNFELTTAKFVPNPFQPGTTMYRTGDLARWLPDGNIEFLGRMDEQVKIRGNRIELGEIEKILISYEGIREGIVLLKDDGQGDKYLAGYYTAGEEIAAADLSKHLSKSLPEYMIPKLYIHLPSFPLTPNGKVDRKALPEPGDNRSNSETQYKAPETEVEKNLVKIWSDLLKREQIGVDDNFFEIGGNSLSLVSLHTQIEKYFPGRVNIGDLFAHSSIVKLAEFIENSPNAVYGNRELTPLEFPPEYFTRPGAGNENAALRYVIKDENYQKLTSLCANHEIELKVALLAAYIYILSSVSGQKTVTVQTIMADDWKIQPVEVSLANIHDFSGLFGQVQWLVKEVKDQYLIQAVANQSPKAGHGIIPCFTNQINLPGEYLKKFDLILKIAGKYQEVDLIYEYNFERLTKEKITEFVGKYAKLIKMMIEN